MFIKRLSVGQLTANCYIVADESSKEAVVIDPGAEGDRILSVINENDLEVKYVFNTHGHIDHIAANSDLLEETNAQLLIHKDDAEFLQNPELNLASFIGGAGSEIELPQADKLLEDGDKIKCGDLVFEIIHTPGHTPGGICLKVNNLLFSGDTLFSLGIGRTDFPLGSQQKLKESINKIVILEDDVEVYPGHGERATLAQIKRKNPYI